MGDTADKAEDDAVRGSGSAVASSASSASDEPLSILLVGSAPTVETAMTSVGGFQVGIALIDDLSGLAGLDGGFTIAF